MDSTQYLNNRASSIRCQSGEFDNSCGESLKNELELGDLMIGGVKNWESNRVMQH